MRLKANTKIAITGMIASGKSTLAENLSEAYCVPFMPEFREDDDMFAQMLQWLYEGRDIEMQLQMYFIEQHFKAQKRHDWETYICDTFLMSHWIFAQHVLDPNTATTEVDRLIKKTQSRVYNTIYQQFMIDVKNPDLMIILDMEFETFVERMNLRGREQEIDNQDENMEYFRSLHNTFTKDMVALCNLERVPYKIIRVDNKTEQEVLEEAKQVITFAGLGEDLQWVE